MEGDDPWRGRYSRQQVLAQVGEEGQRRLGEASVAVVGAGALGTNSAEQLVRAGIGTVRIIDRDVVETSNLHRMRVLGDGDVGRSKAVALAGSLTQLMPGARVEALAEDLNATNALALLDGADLVVDGLDNMASRYLLNDACLEMAIPWVYGGVVGTTGLMAPFPAGGPCLRCLFPEPPSPGALPTCESAGIHPSAPALVASVQVALATRLLLGALPTPRMVAVDLWTDEWRVMDVGQRGDCPACSGGLREFLSMEASGTVEPLCGQDAVQVNPAHPADLDLDAKAREWERLGRVSRRGPVVTLELDGIRLQLFASGRALVKGTSEPSVARTVYARYVGE